MSSASSSSSTAPVTKTTGVKVSSSRTGWADAQDDMDADLQKLLQRHLRLEQKLSLQDLEMRQLRQMLPANGSSEHGRSRSESRGREDTRSDSSSRQKSRSRDQSIGRPAPTHRREDTRSDSSSRQKSRGRDQSIGRPAPAHRREDARSDSSSRQQSRGRDQSIGRAVSAKHHAISSKQRAALVAGMVDAAKALNEAFAKKNVTNFHFACSQNGESKISGTDSVFGFTVRAKKPGASGELMDRTMRLRIVNNSLHPWHGLHNCANIVLSDAFDPNKHIMIIPFETLEDAFEHVKQEADELVTVFLTLSHFRKSAKKSEAGSK